MYAIFCLAKNRFFIYVLIFNLLWVKYKGKVLMNKRIGLLEELIESYPDNMNVKNLLQELYCYYVIYDIDCGTNHHQIFKALYFKRKNYEKVIFDTYISRSTLPRYIKRYNELAKKFIIFKSDYADLQNKFL